jgi:hypothetical protein
MVTPIVHSTNVLPSAHERNGASAAQPPAAPILRLPEPGIAGRQGRGDAARAVQERRAAVSAPAHRRIDVEVAA